MTRWLLILLATSNGVSPATWKNFKPSSVIVTGSFRFAVTGLLLPGERKSVEPMAARIAPQRVRATHQAVHHFVASSPWQADELVVRVRETVLPAIEKHGPITSWIIDDTGIPKKGNASVGVSRQYCGQMGKQENCQVAVSLSIANDATSLPIAYRLYLPQSWIEDRRRRRAAGVPSSVRFATKPQIALDQLRAACAAGVPRGVVVADAAYGNNTEFREGVAELGLSYIITAHGSTTVRRAPLRRMAAVRTIQELAHKLRGNVFHEITWREGTKAPLCSRFAALRVHAAHGRIARLAERLLIEWPADEEAPRKYWFSNLPENTPIETLVAHAQQRWRIERDYLKLKGEIGLGHYEGRSWRGFHHHAALCIAAYGFLVAERGAFFPYGHPRRTPATFHTRRFPPTWCHADELNGTFRRRSLRAVTLLPRNSRRVFPAVRRAANLDRENSQCIYMT